MAMAPSSPYVRSLVCATKRLRISPPSNLSPITAQQNRYVQARRLPEALEHELSQLRLPRAVQATYMDPLKRQPTHDLKVCDLQLRSYSLRNLEVFSDFALRAAYFLRLPASGPRPLPRITERWTVPRGPFVHKKSQENFERITVRRHIQIKDGHPETVALWLAFLQKYRYYGVGMKANVYDWSGLDVAQDLDKEAKAISEKLCGDLESLGDEMSHALALVGGNEKTVQDTDWEDVLHAQPFKGQWGAFGPMSAAASVPLASARIERHVVDDTSKKADQGKETPDS